MITSARQTGFRFVPESGFRKEENPANAIIQPDSVVKGFLFDDHRDGIGGRSSLDKESAVVR
jgi:hypothetical protein